MTSRMNMVRKNPFEEDEAERSSPLVGHYEELNPFDALMPIQASKPKTQNHPPGFSSPITVTNVKSYAKSPLATGKSTSGTASRTERAGSKDSFSGEAQMVKADDHSSSEEDEEEDELDDEDDEDDDDAYTPDSSSFCAGHGSSDYKNRALLFMETNVPVSAGTIQCKLLVLDEGTRFEFVHCGTNRCWMRAQKRKDGLKRLNPATTVSLWVSPVLLVATHKGRGEVDDANISFFDVMRELEMAETMQGEVTKRKDNLLKIGKLRGTPRGHFYQFWGMGKSYKKALGAMDARPEFFALKFQSSGSAKLVLPGRNQPKNRPLKSKDFLMARAKRSDISVRTIRGSKGSSSWQFYQETDDAAPTIRITKQPGKAGEEYGCEFKDVSPAVAFALVLAIAIKSGMGAGSSFLMSSAQSLSSFLPRRASMRRNSLGADSSGVGGGV